MTESVSTVVLDEPALEEAARAYHDIWCGDDYCWARDDGQGYLNDDLERVTAAITAYLQAVAKQGGHSGTR